MEFEFCGIRVVSRPMALANFYYKAIIRLNHGRDEVVPVGIRSIYWNVATLRVLGVKDEVEIMDRLQEYGLGLGPRASEAYMDALTAAVSVVTVADRHRRWWHVR